VVKRSFLFDTVGIGCLAALNLVLVTLTGILIARFLGPAGKGSIALAMLILAQVVLFFEAWSGNLGNSLRWSQAMVH